MLKDTMYDYNVTIIKKYGDTDYCKVSTVRSVRKKGIVDDSVRSPPSPVDGKLLQSLSRSRKVVFEYVMCNEWDFFLTGTFDSSKVDSRYNLDDLHKEFSKFVKAYNRKYNSCIKYVIVPERHKDGAYHFHGVIRGIPSDHLHQFKFGDKMSRNIALQVRDGNVIFDWLHYAERFGFCTLSPIKDHVACSHYITKYITKAFDNDICAFGHLYYCSRGLNKAEKLAQGHLNVIGDIEYTFVTDYCSIKVCDLDTANTLKECLT